MPHCDEETLSLLALGEPASASVSDHLANCPQCDAELASLRDVVTAARVEGGPVRRIAPPPMVWDQIAAATGVSAAPRHSEVLRNSDVVEDPSETVVPSEPVVAPETVVGSETVAVPEALAAPTSVARSETVVAPRTAAGPDDATRSLRGLPRPRRSTLALAATCLLIGLVGGVFGNRLLTDDSSPAGPPVLAATSLAGLKLAPAAVGTADVVETSQGRRLDLDVSRLGAPDGFYEVWLIDPTVTKMVAIGVLSGSTGRFTLPEGVDLRNYPLLDVSVQPVYGDPKHSGRSVLRGTFQT